MNSVPVEPALLRWACDRSGRSAEELKEKNDFKKLDAWLNDDDETNPTLRQLEAFAKATYTPLGYFFLQEPPVEELPIPDFRTIGDRNIARPSPNLLETLYLCQQRQDWFRNEARKSGESPLQFVNSLSSNNDIVASATIIRDALEFNVEQRKNASTTADALRNFIEKVDATGILIMANGVVGSNTHRPLDPEEFRGFALTDDLAPLIFINGADSKAAQMFTLAHELAHIWLGNSGVSNTRAASSPDQTTERWCSRVAAELLVPSRLIKSEFNKSRSISDEIKRLATRYKVSSLVILRCALDAGMLERNLFWSAWNEEVERIEKLRDRDRDSQKKKGGNWYRSAGVRTSKRFARALAISTREGRTTFTEAMRLLSIRRVSTLKNYAHTLGVEM